MSDKTLYITGAGVSAESGIPTFRGEDGFWTIGSINYTPQEMATRKMYQDQPDEFLLWYYKRFASYRHIKPNKVHYWLSDKSLITQNIDGLDGKAGNSNYIPIHGRLDKVTLFHNQGENVSLIDAPWEQVCSGSGANEDDNKLKKLLLDSFKISSRTLLPEIGKSYKPFVLLFDEYYTDLYRMNEAENWMNSANKFVFIGTSFSVNITSIALQYSLKNNCKIEIVDPKPIDIGVSSVVYHQMTANEFILMNST